METLSIRGFPRAVVAVQFDNIAGTRYNYRSMSSLFRARPVSAAAIVLAAGLLARPAHADPQQAPKPPAPIVITKPLADGVTLTQELDANPPLIINVVTADLARKGVRIGTAIANDSITAGTGDAARGDETVESVAARKGAVAAVNGDYYSMGDPLGLGVMDGGLYSEPWKVDRAAFGVEPDGRTLLFDVLTYAGCVTAADGASCKLTAIDRPLAKWEPNDLVAYTQLYGPVSGGRPGCAEVVLTGVNLPLAPNKAIRGTVTSATANITGPETIPDDGLVLTAPETGASAAFLSQHVKAGDTVTLYAAMAPKTSVPAAIQMAWGADSTPLRFREGQGVGMASGDPPGDTSRSVDSTPLPLSTGQGVDKAALAWSQVREAIGGGPRLLTDGAVTIDGLAEGFPPAFTDTQQSRTAVGESRDGKLLLFTVDSRNPLSAGVSLADMAAIMRRYGAVNGINLDGGLSTTMTANGVIVDYPIITSPGQPVADMLLVYADPPKAKPSKSAAITGLAAPIVCWTASPLAVVVDGKRIEGSDRRVLWRGAVDNGVGFVSQDGVFHATYPGTGTVTVLVDGQKVTAPVTVVGKPVDAAADTLQAVLTVVAGSPNRELLSVHISGAATGSLAGIVVNVTTSGASTSRPIIVTDEDGNGYATITWTGASGGTVTLSAGALAPVTLTQSAPPVAAPQANAPGTVKQALPSNTTSDTKQILNQ